MSEITVRTDDGRDISGDTALFRGDELAILGRGETVTVSLSDVRSIIGGPLATADGVEVPA